MWNSGLLDANLSVILLTPNRAEVSQGLAVEVAVPFVVLQEFQRAKGVDSHVMWLRVSGPASATEMLDVLPRKKAAGSRVVPPECSRCAGPSSASYSEQMTSSGPDLG